ncbi:sensor histidine kinase [Loktanella fryxellensis]|nr:HWE histidine kinase domain-containing protein [Loktanella fryxellensis]
MSSLPFVADPTPLLPLGVRVAGLGLGSIDYHADTITLDARAAQLFGLTAMTAMPRTDLHACIHPDDRPDVDACIAAMLAVDGADFVDLVHRVETTDGTPRWLSARKQVTFETGDDGQRRPVSGLVAIMDVTAHKVAERQVQDLMREMNHRLKNLLTVVQSIARMTARTGEPDDFIARFDARIRALAHNQDLLVTRGEAGVTLEALVCEQLHPFTGGTTARISIGGPDVPLRFNAIQPIGLALHELATNAMKYGALSNAAGHVAVTWRVADDALTLSCVETGGLAVVPPDRRGFGSTVLQSMTEAALCADVALDHRAGGGPLDHGLPVCAHRRKQPGLTPAR